jgi:hypothetical protein
MDINLRRPENDNQRFDLHNRVYGELESILKPIWQKFPNGCEHVCLLTDEIVDNRFLHNENTRNIRLRLKVDGEGAGELRIVHDGLPFDDLKSEKRSEVVKGIIERLGAQYSAHYSVSDEMPVLTDSPKTRQTISFKLKN